ncbi:hypothetical protein CHUAL_007607 [Chamberlinius hualienensis]
MVRNIWFTIVPGIILSTFLTTTHQFDYDFVQNGIRVKGGVLDLSAESIVLKLQPGCAKDLCSPNPCRHDSMCALTLDNKEYRCLCMFPHAGRRCEYLGPSSGYVDTNIQYENKMYLLAPHQNVTVGQAIRYCKRKAMKLAEFQNKSDLEYLAGKLKEFFSSAIHKNYRFAMWIGLNKTIDSEKWMWNDASVMNYTDKWAPNRPTNNTNYNFASIRHDESLKYLIHDEPSDGETGWVHFPLCEILMKFYEGNISTTTVPESLKNLI